VAGSFDDCQRLTKAAFANRDLSRRVRLTSANSINVGRLLPQMIYYAHAAARLLAGDVPATGPAVFSTPSGNFGNLTAGVMATRIGIGIRGFIAATNVNDVVPAYLSTGRFEPRPSIPTVANAMDVGNPSNFDRLMWLYDADLAAMRRDISGSRHGDDEVRATIRSVHDEYGYLLDPHSAIAYLGLAGQNTPGVFLATAHPAKFAEIVEPVIGQRIQMPPPLLEALAARRQILDLDAKLEAVQEVVGHESFVDE
jgi:threonine synthase